MADYTVEVTGIHSEDVDGRVWISGIAHVTAPDGSDAILLDAGCWADADTDDHELIKGNDATYAGEAAAALGAQICAALRAAV